MTNFKDSGIEWLDKIPEHWEIKPLKAVFNQRNEQNTNLKLHTILSLIKDIGVVPYEEKGNIGNKSKEDLQSYKIARINDLVLNKMNAVIGSLGVSAYNGLVSPIYLVFYINSPKYLMSYYSYLFQIKNVQKFLKIYAYGIMEIRESIDYLDFKKMSLPVPPLKEQKQIANFLDEKCKQIANFIEKKEKLINLLKEQKQALINETITKGLDKNVNFKDSGIEWLGKIPQHWEVKRLANFGTFLKGNGISRQDLVEYGEPAILYGDIYTKYQIKTHFLYSKISKKTLLSTTPIYNGDILFSGSGETKEDIGKSIVYLGDDNAFAGGDVIIFRQKENNALFLSYVLNTKYANFCKSINSKGEIMVHIYASNLKDIKIPLPPLKEQEQIANFLDEKCEKIDLLIEKTEKQIKLIKEYKTTLINQAVCGRINL
ncbi:restriction endonuclease subunit S [Campylobacter jejuni]|uniref:restriction endonuclease subunit S n=1 Tax=Campylobacter jejuni TaxID=197 RepID=UPI0015BA11E8|nr:restriction endonuclease subunit S [Campylobacter jejuni]NWL54821.1 restriction endonuclease subunit S [Campylobacter jejuni subsp. jejuni]HEC2865377.1 restriction endonuclease subunit S [Campylobacter jejuni]HED9856732.1 restriction endonuclease subunit S [Campylobacter jejuni]HEF6371350.1 restriction endonuclease subunit S [Campylobacter jejuni]